MNIADSLLGGNSSANRAAAGREWARSLTVAAPSPLAGPLPPGVALDSGCGCVGRARIQPGPAALADVFVALDAVQRQLHVCEGGRVQVLLLGVLRQRVGGAAEVVAEDLILWRLDHLPLRLLADGNQLVGVLGDLVEVVDRNPF